QTTHWPMQIVGFPAVAAAAGGLIVIGYAARPGEIAHRVLASPLLTTIGKYSYGAYVYHQLVQPIAESAVAPERFGFAGEAGGLALHVIASMILAVGVAMASWHLFERPFLSLKRYFEYGSGARAQAAAESAGPASR